MHELAARTRVLALRRAADRAVLEHPPRRATRFEPADEAYLIGPYDELLTVLRRDRPSPGHPPDEVTRRQPGPPDQAPERERPERAHVARTRLAAHRTRPADPLTA